MPSRDLPSSDDWGTSEAFTLLEGERFTVYREIVKPDRYHAWPRYFFRWVPILGPEDASWVLAFRLLARRAEGRPVRLSAPKVARLAGISLRTFWRRFRLIESPEAFLSWFVTPVVDEKAIFHHDEGGRIRREADQYIVHPDLPLTPADQAHLRGLLASFAPTQDGPGVIAALDRALKASRRDLLALDPAAPAAEARPLSVVDIARQAVPGATFDPESDALLDELASQLYARLIPDKDHLAKVDHYLFDRWRPAMGHAMFWVVAFLTSLHGGIDEPDVDFTSDGTLLLRDGVHRLAALVGTPRLQTVLDWLPRTVAPKRTKPAESERYQRERMSLESRRATFAEFVQVIDRAQAPDGVDRTDLVLRVAVQTPLTAEDRVAYAERVRVKGAAQTAHETDAAGSHTGNDTMVSGSRIGDGTMVGGPGIGDGTMVGEARIGNGTPVGGPGIGDGTIGNREWHGSNREWHGINEEEEGGTHWHLALLLVRLLDAKQAGGLLDHPACPDGAVFVSWYLYYAARDYDDPPSAAVKKLTGMLERLNRATGADELHDHLAGLGPAGLGPLLAWLRDHPSVHDVPCPLPGGELADAWKASLKRDMDGEGVKRQALKAIRNLGLGRFARHEAAAQAQLPTPAGLPSSAMPASAGASVSESDEAPDEVDDERAARLKRPMRKADGSEGPSPWSVWEMARGQLQRELPKATFDTWVRDAVLLDGDGATFTVGVENAYAKDWLENRLRSTARRTLVGIVGSDVDLTFVVRPPHVNG